MLEERFGAVYSDGPGMPPLPTRLMAGLAEWRLARVSTDYHVELNTFFYSVPHSLFVSRSI